jgi:hypothetical protein
VVPFREDSRVDFVKVLDELARFFDARQVPFAVIGGVGIAGYGMSRITMDLDLVVDGSAQDEVVDFLETLGYQTLYRSSGYSNHQHPLTELGGVDLVYLRGETSRRVFEATRRLSGPGAREIPVPSPEHLIAMKVVAMKNDPSRAYQDLADIRFLLSLPGVDRDEVKRQFEKHGLLERYRELETS